MADNEANPNVRPGGSSGSQSPYLAIAIAFLGVVSSLGTAYITAQGTAKSTAQETAKTTTKDEFTGLTFAQGSAAFVGEIRAFAYGGKKSDNAIKNLRDRGWLECAGQAISHREYPELHELLEGTGSPWGAVGDRVRVPDLRGMFLRGWFNGAVPEDLKEEVAKRKLTSGSKVATGNSVGSFQKDENTISGPFLGLGGSDARNWQSNQDSDKGHGWFFEMYDGPPPRYPQARRETAPKNVLVMYCIYTGRKVDQGTEDGS